MQGAVLGQIIAQDGVKNLAIAVFNDEYGTSLRDVVVKTVESAKDVVYGTVKGGWEPHFVVVYGQVANELEKLGNMLGVEVCKF